MITKISHNKTLLQKGVNTLADAVTVSLGPNGRNILIDKGIEGIVSTKDGVTIAKSISKLEDPIENMGAQLIRQASERSATVAGDGTTTATLLAASLVNAGLLQHERNPVEVKKGIEAACKEVITSLKQISLDISSDEQIKQVATISANNDESIGNIIAEAMSKVGRDGVVTVEQSRTGETFLETVEGMQFDRGYKSPYFVTDNNSMSALLENPFVFMYDGKLTQVKELLPILDYVAKQARPLLIVAEDIDGEALALLVVNKARGILKVAAVKAPEFGDKKTQILEDMAILTGGTVVSSTKGFRLDKFEIGWMGQCRLATVDKHTTTIVDGKGDEALIEARLLELKSQIDKSTSPYEVEKLQERLSKMIGGVAIIHVGANTEVELKEKKDRVDDALHATKAALEEGILPGGGTALLYARESITLKNKLDSSDIRAGKAIMYSVCGAPFHKILSNAGYSSESIYPIMQSARKKTKLNKGLYFGFNIKKEKIVNMVEEGIIDPTKVVRSALENATSVATTILLTEGCIFSEKEKNEESTGMNGFEGMM